FGKTLTRGEMSDMVWRIDSGNTYELSNTYEGIKTGEHVVAEMTSFGDCADLRTYLEENTEKYDYFYDMVTVGEMEMEEATSGAAPGEDAQEESKASVEAPAEMSGAEGGAEGGTEFSTTNIQVEGVDEADIIKNDDQYVYVLKDNTVRIVEAYPPTSMAEVESVTFANAYFYPSEMYVDGDQLIVIGNTSDYMGYFLEDAGDQVYTEMVEVYIFDISDRSNAVLERQLAFEGYYSTSRKVDDMLYVVTNKYMDYWVDWSELEDEEILPLYADTGEDEVLTACGCSDVMFVPGAETSDYMVVTGIPLDDVTSEVETEVVLGYSGAVYASRDNLYVTEPYYSSAFWNAWDGVWTDETIIHKIRLGQNNMAYLGSGIVPGRTLNQFSMDENDGYFRIATTQGSTWDETNPSTNNLYILDGDLTVAGKVEGLAPGEEIYSARFIGDRAYMVTFKTVDPLFVIDVEDPKAPKVLGELKIPGYSDYLHPYDEDHLIGFGLDTDAFTEEEMEEMGMEGAWFQGIKLAMFDVTDVANPQELHKVVIGDRGTYSELSWNHKALLFDKDKGIIAFPITVAEIPQDVKDFGVDNWVYGDYTFQGAYIYDVSVEDGFELRGTITHYDNFDAEYNYQYDYTKWVDRILYIGNYFYTVSQTMVKANEMEDLSEAGEAVME
ncbi:MAG: beta-propeller domain-containing protein, partial [Candidatus Gracilibacteria bacterium]